MLDKVGAKDNPNIADVSRRHYRRWLDLPGSDHDIFARFIRSERNDLVHLYRFGQSDAEPHLLVFDGGVSLAPREFDLFRPLLDGPYANEDARDVFADAVGMVAKETHGDQCRRHLPPPSMIRTSAKTN